MLNGILSSRQYDIIMKEGTVKSLKLILLKLMLSGLICLGFVFGGACTSFGSTEYGNSSMSAEENNAEEPAAVYGRGSYVIGQDMPPGEYAIFTEDDSSLNAYSTCTLSLYKNELDERKIGTFSFQHHGLITLYKGQHLILSRGYAVEAEKAGILPGTSGMYKAGRDMEAGVYRLQPLTSDGARYSLYNDVRYYYDYMDESQTFFEPVTITVQDGQYLELTDVAAIEKIS